MLDINKFEYLEKEHKGFYEGVCIPSVTQLLDIIYPMSKEIDEVVLRRAGRRGTTMHEHLERINRIFIEGFDYEESLEIAIKYAKAVGIKEIVNYVGLLSAWKLQPIMSEKQIFLLDENNDIITFGHLDLIFKAREDNQLFSKDRAYLCDFKNTSTFNKAKTRWQTHAYRVGFLQGEIFSLEQTTYGIHLKNDDAKIIPLGIEEPTSVIEMFKQAKGLYGLCQK